MQTFPKESGWIEVVCGPMFSGKTEELIRRIRRAQLAGQKVQVFKHADDDRYDAGFLVSHDQRREPTIGVRSPAGIEGRLEPGTRVVGIDEVQFFDDSLVAVCNRLADAGIRVIAAGLDMDYRGEPFGPVGALMAVAESVTKASAVCMRCGGPAARSHRLTPEPGRVVVGMADKYEALCRGCFNRADGR